MALIGTWCYYGPFLVINLLIFLDESDYRLKNTTLTFLPGSESLSTTCTNLSIVADKLEEINETAILCISPTEPDVLHEDSLLNITVNIINNDGEL